MELTPSNAKNGRKAIEGRNFRLGAIQVSSKKKGDIQGRCIIFRAIGKKLEKIVSSHQ